MLKILSFFFRNQWIKLLIVLAVVFPLACQPTSPNPNRPKVLISQSTLTKILVQVHLVEAAMNMRRNNGQEFEIQKNILFDSVFTKFSLTPELLEENMLYFNQQPKLMEKIYQDVIDSLEVMQSGLRVEDFSSR
ncbi:MAG TPA: DUF4296 domain-containing protein [Bacteroidales bacterium]|nr:DUF4296 domain-containing protein [Bacteroidales bacterium]